MTEPVFSTTDLLARLRPEIREDARLLLESVPRSEEQPEGACNPIAVTKVLEVATASRGLIPHEELSRNLLAFAIDPTTAHECLPVLPVLLVEMSLDELRLLAHLAREPIPQEHVWTRPGVDRFTDVEFGEPGFQRIHDRMDEGFQFVTRYHTDSVEHDSLVGAYRHHLLSAGLVLDRESIDQSRHEFFAGTRVQARKTLWNYLILSPLGRLFVRATRLAKPG